METLRTFVEQHPDGAVVGIICVIAMALVAVLILIDEWRDVRARRPPSQPQLESDAAKANSLRRKLVDAQAEVDRFLAEQRLKMHRH